MARLKFRGPPLLQLRQDFRKHPAMDELPLGRFRGDPVSRLLVVLRGSR